MSNNLPPSTPDETLKVGGNVRVGQRSALHLAQEAFSFQQPTQSGLQHPNPTRTKPLSAEAARWGGRGGGVEAAGAVPSAPRPAGRVKSPEDEDLAR